MPANGTWDLMSRLKGYFPDCKEVPPSPFDSHSTKLYTITPYPANVENMVSS